MDVRRLVSTVVAFAAALGLNGAAQAAGNRYSFQDAGASAVNFQSTPFVAATPCEAVAKRAGPATALSATLVAGSQDAPEHCRIDGVLPTGIGFQLNFPTKWNGRIYMYGNGGYAGEDAESPPEQASRNLGLRNGFATARTDTGHLSKSYALAAFASDPVKLANHGYLAVHETIGFAKQLAAAYYGAAPRFAYWDGCSTGGREGVMSAQRYPDDFNGIVAAAATLDWSSIMIKGLWDQAALNGSGLTTEKLDQVFKAVLQDCDALDGVRDGLIADPRKCRFDPGRLPVCGPAGPTAECFTDAQIAALRKLYAGPPKGPGTPEWVSQFPGFEHHSTSVPFTLMPGGGPNILKIFADSWVKYIGFKNPDYDPSSFDFARDPQRIRGADPIFNPTTDLAAFKARGGKMITFWGWSDTALNPQMGVDYYDRVSKRYGRAATQDFYRLFLIPGVAHCAGGYGPDDIDAMTAVVNWVELGVAPQRLSARRLESGKLVYNRAYCPYPQSTKFDGAGDPEDPRNYECVRADGAVASAE